MNRALPILLCLVLFATPLLAAKTAAASSTDVARFEKCQGPVSAWRENELIEGGSLTGFLEATREHQAWLDGKGYKVRVRTWTAFKPPVPPSAKRAGKQVAVLVTQEALAALAGGSFDMPRALSGPPMRFRLADAGKELGLPLHGRGASRKLDPKATVAWARDEGVALFACPVWSALLGIADALPDGLEAIEREALAGWIGDAGQVVGSL